MSEKVVYVSDMRIRWQPRGFTGFANGVAEGDVILVEFWGNYYRVRVTKTKTVPNCVTPYVEMELA